MRSRIVLALVSALLIASCSTKPEAVTLADYQRAEKMLGVNTSLLLTGMISNQTWLKNDLLFYKTSKIGGCEFVLANPFTKEKKSAFDHEQLASALSRIGLKEANAARLDLTQVDFSQEDNTMTFTAEGKRYLANLSNYEVQIIQSQPRREFLSPDRKRAAFIKDHNLWVRSTETIKATQLTFDGKEDYGYATNNAGWTRGETPVLLWSPASDKIATFQHDGRGVGEMYLYNTQVGHSKLDKWKYPLPGDSLIFRIERVVIHLSPQPKVVRL